MKHSFLLRIRKQVFDIARSEAKARGISINDFMTYCIEVALAEYMSDSAEAFRDMVTDKAVRKERKKLKVNLRKFLVVMKSDSLLEKRYLMNLFTVVSVLSGKEIIQAKSQYLGTDC